MKKVYLFFILSLINSQTLISQNIKLTLTDSLMSIELHRKGVSAGRAGDFDQSLSYFNQLLDLRRKNYGINSHRLAPPIINSGIQYKNMGLFDKAIEMYKEAERLYIVTFGNDYIELGIVYSNMAIIYKEAGDYEKAIHYHKYALQMLSKDSIKYNASFQILKYNLIETQLRLGYNQQAINYCISNLNTTSPQLKILKYNLLATAYRNKGDFGLSEKYYLLAIKGWIDLYGNNNLELISEYLAYSSLLLSRKEFEKAMLYIKKAEKIVPVFFSSKSTANAEVQSSYGDYYYLKQFESSQIDEFKLQRKMNLQKAIQYYHNAIVSLTDSFNNKDPHVNPKLDNILSEIQMVEELKKKAMVMEKLADIFSLELNYKNSLKYYESSLDALNSSIDLIHRLQVGFENEASKFFLAENQQTTFCDAVRTAYKLFEQTKNEKYAYKAFEFSERSKSSNLLASVKELKAKEFGGIPDSLINKEKVLKANIASYTSMLMEESHSIRPDSQKVNLFSSKIFKHKEDYSKLVEFLEKNFPNYYSLKYENKVTNIKDIQKSLNSRQVLIEFFTSEKKEMEKTGEIYRFLVTKDFISLTKEEMHESFNRNIEYLYNFLTNSDYVNTKTKDFINYSKSSYSLYQTLIQPIEKMIVGKDLTIIPHNKLLYIPFDALITQLPDTTFMNFRNLKYLIKDYAVNYSYSATLLFQFSKKGKSVKKNMLVFSPSYNPEILRNDIENGEEHYFTALNGAKDEVTGISKYVKSDIFRNNLAQEKSFKEKAENYGILHFAMHTIINDSLPMFSKLVFAEPDNNTVDDGFLNTYEIYNLKLNAQLAVLSACETGTGKLQGGEGVMSMARGFIYAGCPSIIMTLWKVEDKSGVQIMKDFYFYLTKGKKKDVALRMAKLNHLNSSDPLTAHPHYWLGYVSIGNPEAMFKGNDLYFVIIVLVIITIISSDFYIRTKRRNKKKVKIRV